MTAPGGSASRRGWTARRSTTRSSEAVPDRTSRDRLKRRAPVRGRRLRGRRRGRARYRRDEHDVHLPVEPRNVRGGAAGAFQQRQRRRPAAAARVGAVDVSLLASALVRVEEEGEEWVPPRLWNAVKHDLRREREGGRDAHGRRRVSGRARRTRRVGPGDVFEEDAVGGGTLGAADFASPAKTGAAAEAKKRKGLLGRMRKKLGKMAGVR